MRIVTNTDFRAYGGRYVIEYAVRHDYIKQAIFKG